MLTRTSRTLIFAWGVFALVMCALNFLTDRNTFWAIWPIWALSMPIAAIVAAIQMPRHRLLGVWLGGGGMLMLGLFAIDVSDGGNWWFFWPGAVWLVLSLAVIGLTVDLLSYMPTSHPVTDDDLTPRP